MCGLVSTVKLLVKSGNRQVKCSAVILTGTQPHPLVQGVDWWRERSTNAIVARLVWLNTKLCVHLWWWLKGFYQSGQFKAKFCPKSTTDGYHSAIDSSWAALWKTLITQGSIPSLSICSPCTLVYALFVTITLFCTVMIIFTRVFIHGQQTLYFSR